MSTQITISNGTITVLISTYGAELKSIVKDGREYLWQGDPEVWDEQSPLLFPICGGLKDGELLYNGKAYPVPKHGYAKLSEFEIEKAENTTATFLLSSNEETLKIYPFEYELRVTYTLSGNKLEVKYSVKNIGGGDMYFSIGGHEGYACPEGIEEYSIVFEHEEDLYSTKIKNGLLDRETKCLGLKIKELCLKNEYFIPAALIFECLRSNKIVLKHRPTDRKIEVDFKDFPNMLVWTQPNAKYLCLEPWCGLPDYFDGDKDFTSKKCVIKVLSGDTAERVHSITL